MKGIAIVLEAGDHKQDDAGFTDQAKGGDTIVKVGRGGGSEYVTTTLSHLGGSGGMLPRKFFELGLFVSISDAF